MNKDKLILYKKIVQNAKLRTTPATDGDFEMVLNILNELIQKYESLEKSYESLERLENLRESDALRSYRRTNNWGCR